ncbi:MAG: OB-fold domain-containing protein [Candidatus Binatia bacterium]
MALQLNQRYVKYYFDPVAESFEEPFWEYVKRRELRFQRCGRCREWLHPPRPMCHKCKSDDLRWEPSAGTGRIYSWVVFRREVNPLYVVPFEVVLVEMDAEKPVRMVANMLDSTPEELQFGMPVEIDFFDVTPEKVMPIFKKRTP